MREDVGSGRIREEAEHRRSKTFWRTCESERFLVRPFEFCRERPPWRSAERKTLLATSTRNATEGVLYSCVIERKQSD
jgi:hypothetical protein